jgi:hypothetical protein
MATFIMAKSEGEKSEFYIEVWGGMGGGQGEVRLEKGGEEWCTFSF